jgi:hypothetical protein
VWAGHRFDITTEDSVSEEDCWKDVSGEVIKETYTLLRLYEDCLERVESLVQAQLRGKGGGTGR